MVDAIYSLVQGEDIEILFTFMKFLVFEHWFSRYCEIVWL